MENERSYNLFYEILSELQEEFHKIGSIDDANSKLDEIIKLLIINYYHYYKFSQRFNIELIENFSKNEFDSPQEYAKSLKMIFKNIAEDDIFKNNDGTNIFGEKPDLVLKNSENELAKIFILQIQKINFNDMLANHDSNEFDIINEMFGSFVRDNFRNNKEDAQYMTPKEVVMPILQMIINDSFQDENFIESLKENKLKIMDPTCGVGTMIIETSKEIIHQFSELQISPHKKEEIISNFKNDGILGQDKVDRMVRFSKVNLLLFNSNVNNIFHGNSIVGKSKINDYMNDIDLIVTNPPFGAVYNTNNFKNNSLFPIINSLPDKYSNIDSELAMIDKSLSLLKPGGKLVIVVPDSVVSAKGIYEDFRNKLIEDYNIKAIIDLPSETFAQAGTRTKCVVLYIEKDKSLFNEIFIGICSDIGFKVKNKKGIPVKIYTNKNEMPEISNHYINRSIDRSPTNKILNPSPSCTIINQDNDLKGSILTPNFYNANILQQVEKLNLIEKNNEFKAIKLEDLVHFNSQKRNRLAVTNDTKHISVLHINSDTTIDFNQVEAFQPISKGIECFENEILFSKINPRIPRMAVVPMYNKNLVCSNEFEILVPKDNVDPHLLTILLQSNTVQSQIRNLTSGTSSSHNRIKREQLKEIIIPYPLNYLTDSMNIKDIINQKYEAHSSLTKIKNDIENKLTFN
ncbi:N-6 DNA methylase [Staphylococcus saprophyticus]|nr:N-6 DNA methylase [Staphylococcus saprophyticus]